MAIFRVHKDNNFTVISNDLIRDKRLSLKARGLMILMLSLPDDWDFSVAGLASINQESEKTIKTMLAELKEFGYLVVTKKMPNETDSKKIEYIYDLFEIPENKNQGTQNQHVDEQPIENSRQLNKEEQRKEEQSTFKEKSIKKKFDAIAFLDTIPGINKDPEIKEAFINFIEMRESIKHPVATEFGLKQLINQAWELGDFKKHNIIAILNQSTAASYRGLFALKNNNQIAPRTAAKASGSSGTNESALDFFNRIEAEELAKEAAT